MQTHLVLQAVDFWRKQKVFLFFLELLYSSDNELAFEAKDKVRQEDKELTANHWTSVVGHVQERPGDGFFDTRNLVR
ncbi:hypothetical protein HYQ46_005831 [Verticillium longisporum]|nr:hypothetical protein HYQ46_005831 [Verticillium longisporum]